jgi:hypothetical protein
LLGSGIATCGFHGRLSGLLVTRILRVEPSVVSIIELLKGLACHQLHDNGVLVQRGRNV